MVEQVPGDVAEDDVPVFPHEIEGPEGYKAVTRPDVKQGLAPLHGGILQNTVPPGKTPAAQSRPRNDAPATTRPICLEPARPRILLSVDRGLRFLAAQYGRQVLSSEGGHLFPRLDGGAADVRG